LIRCSLGAALLQSLFSPAALSQETCPRVPPPQCADASTARNLEPVYQAIREGRLLATDAAGALLEKLPAPDSEEEREDRRAAQVCLAQALEDQGNEVMKRYVKGDEMPPQTAMYGCGKDLFDAANKLLPSARLEARALFFKARLLLLQPNPQQSTYDEAIRHLTDSIAKDPKDTYHHNALGLAYLTQEKYQDAKPWFDRAIELDDKWFFPRHHLALILIEKGQYDAARQEYERLIREAETGSSPQKIGYLHYNLALLLHSLRDFSGAAHEYDLARRIFEEKSALAREQNDLEREELFRQRQAEALNALGALSATQGNLAAAQASYRKALGLNPRLYAARHNLALLHFRHRDRQREAIALWEENTGLSPEYLPSQLSLARFYADKGVATEAIKHYSALLQSSPEFRDALLGLGDAYAAQGKVREACLQYEKAATEAGGQPDWRQLDRRRRNLCAKRTTSTATAPVVTVR